ncbi:hypothetical protein [Treponema zioleckii]|uniref:hypothetical protein n=1 Tax=Treponema zioleckii TaxID=331680 RepID=UPI00168B5201|nr:hypothetical protein [Treponema zioleckii]
MKKSKLFLAVASSALILSSGFFLSCSDDAGDDVSPVTKPSEPISDDENNSVPEDGNQNENPDENGGQDSATEAALPIIPKGANSTKIEGAGIWIYLDNSELKISGANAAAFAKKTTVTLTDSTDNSSVPVKSFQFDDYGPNESTVRLMILMNDAAHTTLKANISIRANGKNYAGTAKFKNGAYKFDFAVEDLIVNTSTSALEVPQGESIGLIVTDTVYKTDITEDCVFEVDAEGILIEENMLKVSESAPEGDITVKVTHKSGISKTLALKIVASGTKVGINWDSVNWLGNGSGDGKNTDKYKIKGDVKEIVNIQKPGWENLKEAGIFVVMNSGISECSLGSGTDKTDFYIQGAGILLYLSNFTQKETEFTITDTTGPHTVTVYFADGN